MNGPDQTAPKAIILAAGKGTRLRPLTNLMPKAMVPVGGRPLLEHTIELLRQHGVREIAINVHAHAEAIAEHFGDGSRLGVRLSYSFEPLLLGTAGAVKKLHDFFKDGTFYVIYGDVLTQMDLSSLLEYHQSRRALATIALHQPEDASRCGVVQQDEDGRITSFIERPEAGTAAGAWANAGVYVVEPALLRQISEDGPQDFGRDVFPEIIAKGEAIAGFRSDAAFWDIGSAERLRRCEDWMLTLAGKKPRRNMITDIAGEYIISVQEAISSLDLSAVAGAAELILDVRARGNQVVVVGNGGSAATASHMASDLTRAAADSPGPPLRCRSLTDNVPLLTALSNDIAFESAFAWQVEQLMDPGDVLVAISASGQSPNIIAAAEAAHRCGGSVVGLVGFGGGQLAEVADASIVVASDEYGPVEDTHLLLNHLLATMIRLATEPEETLVSVHQAERRPKVIGAGNGRPAAESC